MSFTNILSKTFEKIPERPWKNSLRYFLAFNKLVPESIKNISPIKGYTLFYIPKRGDIVIDAGAYPGDFAVFASRIIGTKGKIICFEPNADNRRTLERNLKANNIKNYVIIPKGLWSKNTILKFKMDGLHSSVSDKKRERDIEVVRLDDALKKLKIKSINFIKMDIEGAEIEALKGARNTLIKSKASAAIASYHKLGGKDTSSSVEKLFKKMGYKTRSDFKNHLTTYAWKD